MIPDSILVIFEQQCITLLQIDQKTIENDLKNDKLNTQCKRSILLVMHKLFFT